jgi:hypothetical protein
MTREGEIEQAAIKRFGMLNCDAAEYFIGGAEWADRTMIERACDWIEEFMQMTPSKKTFIKRFKQAMKGE